MVSVRGERGQVEWKGPVAWSRAIRRITCCDGGDPAVWFTHSAYRAVLMACPVPQTEQGIRRGGVALVPIVLGRVGT
jgi:hypothetical protein